MLRWLSLLSLGGSLFCSTANAAAVPKEKLEAITSAATLIDPGPGGITDYLPYSLIAAAAYCVPEKIQDWSCGHTCEALGPNWHVTATGGDGAGVQYWFTAYWEEKDTVVVAHQGTDPSHILALLTDLDFFRVTPNATLFPGVSEDVGIHHGFREAHEKTADDIYAGVLTALHTYNTTSITLVGHSLGAAIALLDGVSLRLRLPQPQLNFKLVTYGMPRVGNQEFADLVDNLLPDLTHVANKKDPIPIVPAKSWGFVHPKGEIHITEDLNWLQCPGQESDDPHCMNESASLPFNFDLLDHIGYYNDVLIQCWGIADLPASTDIPGGPEVPSPSESASSSSTPTPTP